MMGVVSKLGRLIADQVGGRKVARGLAVNRLDGRLRINQPMPPAVDTAASAGGGNNASARGVGYRLSVATQLLGRLGNMVANLASLALIARVLSREAFGNYVLVTGLAMLLAQIADFGTGPVFAQHVGAGDVSGDGRPLGGRYWGSFLLLRGALAAVATAFGIALALSLGAVAVGPMMLASLSVGFIAARFLDPLYQVGQRPFRSTIAQLSGATALLAGATLAALLHPTLIGFLVSFLVANVIFVAVSWLAARDLVAGPVAVDRTILRQTLILAAPMGFAGLMTSVNGRANLLFLAHFQGPDAVGLYGAATRVLDLAVNLAVVVLWPLIPVFSRSAQAGIPVLAAELRRIIRLLLQLVLPLLVVAPYAAPLVIRALYGASYAAAAPILSVLALVGFGVVWTLLGSYALLALRITRYALRITAIGMAANLALNALLVPRYGPMGAAIAAAATEFVLVAQMTIVLIRHVPKAVDGRTLLAMLCAAGLAAALLAMLVPMVGPAVAGLALLPSGFTALSLLRARSSAHGGGGPIALAQRGDAQC